MICVLIAFGVITKDLINYYKLGCGGVKNNILKKQLGLD